MPGIEEAVPGTRMDTGVHLTVSRYPAGMEYPYVPGYQILATLAT